MGHTEIEFVQLEWIHMEVVNVPSFIPSGSTETAETG